LCSSIYAFRFFAWCFFSSRWRAAIPAAIILSIIAFVLSAVFWAIIGGAPQELMERWKL
jgi:hypothetical protein